MSGSFGRPHVEHLSGANDRYRQLLRFPVFAGLEAGPMASPRRPEDARSEVGDAGRGGSGRVSTCDERSTYARITGLARNCR
jgi:hypothetical protein